MRRLIEYFKSCFCHHDWELIYVNDIYDGQYCLHPYETHYTYRCKKCRRVQKLRV